MKDLEEHLLPHLLKQGQLVYIQADRIHRRNKGVSLRAYDDDDAIEFFSNLHGKLITLDDVEHLLKGKKRVSGEDIFVRNGTNAIVMSCFHWGYTDKQIQELLEAEKIESKEDATPMLYCFLLLNDRLVLSRMSYCNTVMS